MGIFKITNIIYNLKLYTNASMVIIYDNDYSSSTRYASISSNFNCIFLSLYLNWTPISYTLSRVTVNNLLVFYVFSDKSSKSISWIDVKFCRVADYAVYFLVISYLSYSLGTTNVVNWFIVFLLIDAFYDTFNKDYVISSF